jgi:hypothetical protein
MTYPGCSIAPTGGFDEIVSSAGRPLRNLADEGCTFGRVDHTQFIVISGLREICWSRRPLTPGSLRADLGSDASARGHSFRIARFIDTAVDRC